MLNLNWQKRDSHTGQAVAIMLDIRMWLKVFEKLQWESDWIDDIMEKFHRVYNDYNASKEHKQKKNVRPANRICIRTPGVSPARPVRLVH